MKITSKGQVTIPVHIREKLDLLPNTEVMFRIGGNAVRILKANKEGAHHRGNSVLAKLRGTADTKMSTKEILALTRGE